MAIPNTTFRVFVEKLGNIEAVDFIGNEGDLFYDPNTTTLRVSDGSTPGGSQVLFSTILNTFNVQDGDILVYNSSSGQFITTAFSGGGGGGGVTFPSATDGQVLVYDGGAGTFISTELSSITGIGTTANDGEILVYDSSASQFVARELGIVGINTLAGTGYEFTGAFVDRNSGQSGATTVGTAVTYSQEQADDGVWRRFGFSVANQVQNDVEYWGETDPAFDQTLGLFGGLQLPSGYNKLFDFGFNDPVVSSAQTTGGLLYTAAEGSYDFTDGAPGDFAQIRFSFNVIPQQANTTIEVGLIWSTRDQNDNVTFTFPLTTQPIFYGTGTVGRQFLNRVTISAYFASDEDVNARALPAIRADNPILIEPLTTLATISR